MNESQKLYIDKVKEKLEAIVESGQYQVDQQLIMFNAICEDLLLLNNAVITSQVKKYFDAETENIKSINDLAKKIGDITQERIDNMKNFHTNFKKL